MEKKTEANDKLEIAHKVNDRANRLYRSGRYEEAAPVFEEAYGLFHMILGDKVQGTQNVMCNMAKNYLKLGQQEKAIEICLKILDESPMAYPFILRKIRDIGKECGRVDILRKVQNRMNP